MTDIDVASIRAALIDHQADLHRQIEELDVASDEAADFDDNFADSGQVAAELGENQALVLQFKAELADVEAALGRLDDGTYGRCEVCDQPIGEARLEAIPATRFCINHA